MKNWQRFATGCALTGMLSGCMAEVDDESAIATETQEFKGFSMNPNYLMDRIAMEDTIIVCLTGSNVTSSNFNQRKQSIINAMMPWINAAKGAAVSPPSFDSSDIYFHSGSTCHDQPDIDIIWNTGAGGHLVTQPNGYIRVELSQYPSTHDLLHEMGHVFGLHDTYWQGHTGCLPGQPESVMCGRSVSNGTGFTTLQSDDIRGVQEIYCVANPSASECNLREEWGGGWCSHANGRLFVGDFNGDGNRDLLCHDVANGNKWITYTSSQGILGSSSWSRATGWCAGSNDELHIGDFNGDGRDDMLCHDKSQGDKDILWANSSGAFNESTNHTYSNINWCSHPTGKLYVGDFDGDGKDDTLCHDKSSGYSYSGYIWIDYRSDGLDGTDWSQDLDWCTHSNGRLHIGDVDGDGEDDIVCQDVADGNVWIDYAFNGGFAGTNSTYFDGFCYGSGGQFLIADMNGDGREDLVCHNPQSGYKKLAFATTNFTNRFVGTSREWQMNWCSHSTGQFLLGDFDDNGVSDFLCHDTSTGYKWQAFQYH